MLGTVCSKPTNEIISKVSDNSYDSTVFTGDDWYQIEVHLGTQINSTKIEILSTGIFSWKQ